LAPDGVGDIHRDRADLRVRHHAARAEHLTETADETHHVRRRDAAIEIDLAAVDLLEQVFGADDVGAGGRASSAFAPLANTATRAVRPVPFGSEHDAADHLVGLLRRRRRGSSRSRWSRRTSRWRVP
jgi:hypothetical protein